MKVGDFSLQLVDATTKEPFKEHVAPSDGQVYAEVEPGLDYFMSVGTDRGGVMINYRVDGVDLGYHTTYHGAKHNDYRGNWSRLNGVTQTTSFKFNIAQTRCETDGHDEADAAMMTGKVELIVHELGAKTMDIPRDYTGSAQEEKLEEKSKLGDKKMKGKKCLVSTAGSVPLDANVKAKSETKSKIKAAPKPTAHYARGAYITTVTLNYCSTVGLIINKILDAPPEEEETEEDIKPMKKKTKRGEQLI